MQRSVERVTLGYVPLNVICEAVGLFEHVKELECLYIGTPQQVCLCYVLLLTHTIQSTSFECCDSMEEKHDYSSIYMQ